MAKFTLTNEGAKLLARNLAGEGTLNFTTFRLGSGNFTGDVKTITDMVDQFGSFPIRLGGTQGDGLTVRVDSIANNTGFTQQQELREKGIYCQLENDSTTEVLYSYVSQANYETLIPAASTESWTKAYKVLAQVNDATNISVTFAEKKDKYDFNTVAEMVAAAYLVDGDRIQLWGYYNLFDGATHKRIKSSTDDGSGIALDSGGFAVVDSDGETNVKWFGAKGDGVTDDSAAFQKCFDVSGVVNFGKGVFLISNTIDINRDVEINANKAIVLFDGIKDLFNITGKYNCSLNGGRFEAYDYPTDRPVIFFSVRDRNFDLYPDSIRIENVETLNVGLCDSYFDTSNNSNSIKVINNVIKSDDLTNTYMNNVTTFARAWLFLSGTDGQDVDISASRKGSCDISNNVIDVFHQDGANVDIIKLGGNFKQSSINENTMVNRNPVSDAEIDTFTGGFNMSFESNIMENISVKLQTHSGSLAPRVGETGYSTITNNKLSFTPASRSQWAVLYKGSFASISNNIIRCEGTNRAIVQGDFRAIALFAMDNNDNGFGGNKPSAISVSGNMVRISQTTKDDVSQRVRCIDLTNIKGCTVTGNVFAGGWDLIPVSSDINRGNTMTGNEIYSPNFTNEGTWYLQNSIKGGNNRIGRSNDYGNETNSFFLSEPLTHVVGVKTQVTLSEKIYRGTNQEFAPFYLHVYTVYGSRNNFMTFFITNGDTDDQETDPNFFRLPLYSRINYNTTVLGSRRNCFEVSYPDEGGNIVLRAIEEANVGDPTELLYMIEPVGVGSQSKLAW